MNRLRNLKKQEIEDKLAQIQRKSGAESMPFTGEELDEDFDPDEHDKKMRVSFLTGCSVGLWCISVAIWKHFQLINQFIYA